MPHRSSPRNYMILFYKKEKFDWSLDIFASFGGVMGDPARQQVTKFVRVRATGDSRQGNYFCRSFSGPMNCS